MFLKGLHFVFLLQVCSGICYGKSIICYCLKFFCCICLLKVCLVNLFQVLFVFERFIFPVFVGSVFCMFTAGTNVGCCESILMHNIL